MQCLVLRLYTQRSNKAHVPSSGASHYSKQSNSATQKKKTYYSSQNLVCTIKGERRPYRKVVIYTKMSLNLLS